MVTSSLNTLSDLLVFLWPAPKLWDVALPKRQRVCLITVFSLGCIVCIAGIVRIAYYPTFFASKDVFWEGAIITIAGSVEYDLAIICGSLPEIRPLVIRMLKGSSGETVRTYNSDSGGLGTLGRVPREQGGSKVGKSQDSFGGTDDSASHGEIWIGNASAAGISSQELMRENGGNMGRMDSNHSGQTWVEMADYKKQAPRLGV